MDLISKPASLVTLLEADSILLEYNHRKVLQDVYLRVEKGEIVGLLGRNGCGKSSLLEIIYGIRSAQNSSVRVDGKYISKAYREHNLIAYLPQRQFVPGYLKVKEAFKLYQSRLEDAIDYLPELERLQTCRFSQLSGGQLRLVETILVISCPAAFVVLDEPFSNLMPLHVQTLRTWLSALKKEKGILITDHYYRDVLGSSDRVYLLTTGGRAIHLSEPAQQLRELGYIH